MLTYHIKINDDAAKQICEEKTRISSYEQVLRNLTTGQACPGVDTIKNLTAWITTHRIKQQELVSPFLAKLPVKFMSNQYQWNWYCSFAHAGLFIDFPKDLSDDDKTILENAGWEELKGPGEIKA